MADKPEAVKRAIIEPSLKAMQAPGAALTLHVKTWHHVNEPNAAAAISFINASPPQGAGEASFTNGPNGSVDVYYFL